MAGVVPAASYGRNLALRVASALVLAPAAIGAAYLGGPLFAVFWVIAAIAVFWEWNGLVNSGGNALVFSAGAGALAVAAVLAERELPVLAVAVILAGSFSAAGLASRERRIWSAAGVGYAGAMLMAPIVLRHDATFGFAALALLFAIVWTTDVAGYFVGRLLGGPKLAPMLSPNKSWSGALGGTAVAVLVGLLVAGYLGIGNLVAIGVVSLARSIVGQVGDLFESALKRRFGAKDSSTLIPGHGGVMDRLDAFWCAALVAALTGLARGGFDAPARGLMLW